MPNMMSVWTERVLDSPTSQEAGEPISWFGQVQSGDLVRSKLAFRPADPRHGAAVMGEVVAGARALH